MTSTRADRKERAASAARVAALSHRSHGRMNGNLTDPVKLALLVLLRDGEVNLLAGSRGAIFAHGEGQRISFQTIEAIFERGLAKLVVESRHKKRRILRLTELGECAARGIILASIKRPAETSERAKAIIESILNPDDFEGSDLVYSAPHSEAA